VNKDNISIVGSRAAVIDATGFETGIRVGTGRISRDGVPACPPLTVNNFTLRGLTIKNARVRGIFLIGVNGYRLTGSRYIHNPVSGPVAVCSQNGLIDFNFVKGGNAVGTGSSIDAGIYVDDDDKVTVEKNFVTNHAIGIEIENSSNAIVRRNFLRGNTTGILVVVLPGLPMPFTDNVRIERNEVIRNNLPNPVPADSDDLVGLLPTGIGILNVGGDRVVIRKNRVIGNDSVGVAIVQNPFAGADPRIEPFPDGNEVRDNVILRNGHNPDPARATTPGADIVYDGTGVGTCFAGNIFRIEFPAEITASVACP
jgi:parallel beta-helix repeat protein